MGGGYVLDFSNQTFAEFVVESTRREIYDSKYNYISGSKANRLRAFWAKEPNHTVGKLIHDLLEYCYATGSVSTNDPLVPGCRRIAQRLLQGALVEQIDAIATEGTGNDHDCGLTLSPIPATMVL